MDGGRGRDAAMSGLFAGLAILTKSPAAFLIPFTLLLSGAFLLSDFVRRKRGGASAVGGRVPPCPSRFLLGRGLLLWGLAAALTFFALWPALWADPLGTIQAILGIAGRYAVTPHTNNFWFGHVVRDLGLPFYLLAFAFRLTPVTCLGLLVTFPLLVWRGDRRTLLLALQSYVVLFVLMLSLAAKKFDRYLLPCFPASDLAAAMGIVALLRWAAAWRRLEDRLRRAVLPCGIALLVLIQAASTLPHHPYYLSHLL